MGSGHVHRMLNLPHLKFELSRRMQGSNLLLNLCCLEAAGRRSGTTKKLCTKVPIGLLLSSLAILVAMLTGFEVS